MSVTPNISRLYFDPRGGDIGSLSVTYTGGMTYQTPVISYVQGDSGWLSCVNERIIESDDVDVIGYVFRATSVTGGGDVKTATITFEDQTGTAEVTVYQVTKYIPSWSGVVYTFRPEDGEEIHYRIYDEDDNIVFEGVAISNIQILVGDIVYNYILTRHYTLPSERLNFLDSGGYGVFRLVKVDDEEETDVMVWAMTTDWSYKEILSINNQYTSAYEDNTVLNNPINNKGCVNMMYSLCIYNADNSTDWTIVRTRRDGTEVSYNTTNNLIPFGARNIYVDNNTSKITFKKGNKTLIEYDTTYCGFGSLVYRNRFGGYDSFLVEGNIRKKENYTRDSSRAGTNHQLSKKVNNTVVDNVYELTTGWLTDEEAERLVFNLLSSPDVRLLIYDNSQYVRPTDMYWHIVNIVDTSAEYKKFRNDRRLIQYVITVEENNNIVKR